MYILVIDDNQGDRLLVERELQRELSDLHVEAVGQLTEANPAFLQLLGVNALEAIAVDQFSNLFSKVEGLALNWIELPTPSEF
ncbi:MAG TPA: hypothetical protein V6C63_07610 [Allocoleopsis sp.]